MTEVMTQEVFKETFGDLMLHGLDSKNTYIPLRTNKRYGLNVAIRPMVMRPSAGVVLFGGKLRVGYTLDDQKIPVKTNICEISDEVRMQRLTEFCKGFSWQKQNFMRFSTIIGLGIAGSLFDGERVIQSLEDNKTAEEFINRLERTYKQYNQVSFGAHKKTAIEALHAAWVLQASSPRIFKALYEFTPLPESVVGKQSPILNKAQDKYKDNVIGFQQKIDDWAAAAQAKEEDSA